MSKKHKEEETDTVGQASGSEKNNAKVNPALERLIECQRVLELIKTQFGYSGYSHPNYLAVCKAIEDNKKVINGK